MNIKLTSIYGWSIGTDAKAKYFTAKKQNKEDIYFALREIVDSYQDSVVADFTVDATCKDNPNLNGTYYLSLYFNRTGDTFYELRWAQGAQIKYLAKLHSKNVDEYDAVTRGLFEAIVATREFKQFARKATNNIQDCFKDVIEPLYRGELRISDELDLDRDEITEEERRKAIKGFMKIKGRIVSSSTLNLSHPEFENFII